MCLYILSSHICNNDVTNESPVSILKYINMNSKKSERAAGKESER